MENKDQLEKSVKELYSKYPFPGTKITQEKDIHNSIVFKVVHSLISKYLNSYKNKKIKILDAGCGTGNLSLGLSSENRTITGIDISEMSLKQARKIAKKFCINNVFFIKKDLAHDKLGEQIYDFTFSIGVIHHIPNSELIFKKLVDATKIGGYLVIGVYSPYGMFRKRVERKIVHLLAGKDLRKRVKVARILFYRREVTPQEKIGIADVYAHPLQQHFSIEKMLKWFKKYNIKYVDSEPPIEIRKNLTLMYSFVKNFFSPNRKDLISLWNEAVVNNSKLDKQGISLISIKFVQFGWLIIGAIFGRGEFINIVGQREQ